MALFMRGNILSVYFGYHDSCVTFASEEKILLHLEAERVFRKKHMRVTSEQMMDLISVGMKYTNLDIIDIDRLYVSKWNNQFRDKVELFGR